MLWYGSRGELHGLNASGPAPANLSIEEVRRRGYRKSMPEQGVIPITVPGVPGAWAALSQRFGRLPLTSVLQPAIDYAQHGYPVSPTLATYWHKSFQRFAELSQDNHFKEWLRVFAP